MTVIEGLWYQIKNLCIYHIHNINVKIEEP